MSFIRKLGRELVRGKKFTDPFYEAHPEIPISVSAIQEIHNKHFPGKEIRDRNYELMFNQILEHPDAYAELQRLIQEHAEKSASTPNKRKKR